MKVWTTIACVSLAALSSARVNAADNCVANCVEIFKPVCGSDGKTYENQCAFDFKKCSSKDDKLTVKSEGACASSSTGSGGGIVGSDCVKGCPKIMRPVCGSDGKTYNSECELNNAKCSKATLTVASNGSCGSTAGSAGGACATTQCMMDYTPVCGSDGKTYSNQCKLDNEKCTTPSLTMVSPGECGTKSKMGSLGSGGEASAAGSKAGAISVTPAPAANVPTPAPTSSAGTHSVQVAAAMAVSVVAACLL